MKFKLGLSFVLALFVGFMSFAALPGCGGDNGGGAAVEEGPDPVEESVPEDEELEEEIAP